MKKVAIVSACRTPIGKMGGCLSELSAVELGSIVIEEAVNRAKIKKDEIDHVYMGCVIQAALGQNVARQASIKAGLPYTTTAETINAVCGSGLDAVNLAARMIAVGEADVVVAGGMESMSKAPFAIPNARYGYKMGGPMVESGMIDTMVNDALWDAFNNYHMGVTAENLVEKWGLTRNELDLFSIESQQKAFHAIENKLFEEEIVPVKINKRGTTEIIDKDEAPRKDLTMENLSRLKPVFKKDGIVTAGNSSGINDGAAAIVLMSEERAKEMGVNPIAVWCGGTMAGVEPSIMGIAPVEATKKLLKKLNMTIEEIDLIEANEAFAAQSIAVKRELNISSEKLNVNGGAIALGHPVGASGCRILVTLLYAMKQRNMKTGLATLCIGGGMGCATIIERV